MPNVSLAGVDRLNIPGSLITGILQTSVRCGAVPVVIVGAAVADHGSGAHNAAHLVQGSTIARVGGIPIVRAGDAAGCGHVALGTGHVRINA